jgi:serine/threonine protein kinase
MPNFLNATAFAQKYEIDYEKLIAKGAYGSVYDANAKHKSPECDTEIVVKICKEMDDIMVEIDHGIRLNHSGIIKPLDICLGDETFIIYPKGMLIDDYLNLYNSEFKRLTIELIQILDYLYNQGVAHCDIKPSNIIVINHHAVLIDFGISNTCHLSTTMEKVFDGLASYTNGFVPPDPNYGFRSISGDVFSMGKTFQCLYTGKDQYLSNIAISTDDILLDDLLSHMICPQETRMSPSELLQHPYISSEGNVRNAGSDRSPMNTKIYPSGISVRMHYILVSWMLEVCHEFKFSARTTFLCLHNMARSVGVLHEFDEASQKTALQAFGTIQIYLAYLIYETTTVTMNQFINLSNNVYTKIYMYEMLRLVMNELGGIVNVSTLWDHCISGDDVPSMLKCACEWEYPNVVIPEPAPASARQYMSKFIRYNFSMTGPPVSINGICIFNFMRIDAIELTRTLTRSCVKIIPKVIYVPQKSIEELKNMVNKMTNTEQACDDFFNTRDNYALIYALRSEMESDVIFANVILSNVLSSVLKDSYDIVFGAEKLQKLSSINVGDLSINCYTSSVAEILEYIYTIDNT